MTTTEVVMTNARQWFYGSPGFHEFTADKTPVVGVAAKQANPYDATLARIDAELAKVAAEIAKRDGGAQ